MGKSSLQSNGTLLKLGDSSKRKSCTLFCAGVVLLMILVCVGTEGLVISHSLDSFVVGLSPLEDFVIPVNAWWYSRLSVSPRLIDSSLKNEDPSAFADNSDEYVAKGGVVSETIEFAELSGESKGEPSVFLFDHSPKKNHEVARRQFERDLLITPHVLTVEARSLLPGSVLELGWHKHTDSQGNSSAFLIVFDSMEKFQHWEKNWNTLLRRCAEDISGFDCPEQRWYCGNSEGDEPQSDLFSDDHKRNPLFCSDVGAEGTFSQQVPEGRYLGSSTVQQGGEYFFVWGNSDPSCYSTSSESLGDSQVFSDSKESNVHGSNPGSIFVAHAHTRADYVVGSHACKPLKFVVETEILLNTYDPSSVWKEKKEEDGISVLRSNPQSSSRGVGHVVDFSLGFGGITHIVVFNPSESRIEVLCVVENRIVLYLALFCVAFLSGSVLAIWTVSRKSKGFLHSLAKAVTLVVPRFGTRRSHLRKRSAMETVENVDHAECVATFSVAHAENGRTIKRRNTGPSLHAYSPPLHVLTPSPHHSRQPSDENVQSEPNTKEPEREKKVDVFVTSKVESVDIAVTNVSKEPVRVNEEIVPAPREKTNEVHSGHSGSNKKREKKSNGKNTQSPSNTRVVSVNAKGASKERGCKRSTPGVTVRRKQANPSHTVIDSRTRNQNNNEQKTQPVNTAVETVSPPVFNPAPGARHSDGHHSFHPPQANSSPNVNVAMQAIGLGVEGGGIFQRGWDGMTLFGSSGWDSHSGPREV